MAKPALTEAIQDYLREIYKLGADGARVSVTALAKRQGVSAASASAMVKKLAALELAISEELEAKIDRALGYPTHDPHGDPIPDADLNWPPQPAAAAAGSSRR